MASENYNDEIKERFLKCVVCLEMYDEDLHTPRLLPCLHTFCSACIKIIIGTEPSKKIISCPLCKTEHSIVSKNKEKTFPKDNTRRDLLQFIETKDNSEVLCTVCNDNTKAIYRCKECATFLCDPCYEAHKGKMFTKNHKIFKLEDLKNNPELLNEFIPEVCKVYDERKISVKRLQENINEKILQMKNEKETVEREKSGLQENGNEIVNEIQNAFDNCILKLQARKEKIIKTAKEKIKSKEEILKDQIKSLQEQIEELEERYQYIEETINCTDAAELLEIEIVTQQRLQHLENEESKRIKDVNIDFEFQENEMITNFKLNCNKMGNIVNLKDDSATGIRHIPGYTEETTRLPQDVAENVFGVVIEVTNMQFHRTVCYKFQENLLRKQLVHGGYCSQCKSILDLLQTTNEKGLLFQKTGDNVTWNGDISFARNLTSVDEECNWYLSKLKESLAKYGIK